MSRAAPSRPAPIAKRDARVGGSGDVQDGELHTHLSSLRLHLLPSSSTTNPPPLAPEICPVCKSSRYLNTSLRFLVNPECYHKMCESCVDRIFSHGPAACPLPGCKRTLRKHRFREQTFEDIKVEREVDVRRRVAAVFNRREEEFESVRAWNDYLNEVEDITFNLVNQVDVEETRRRFEEYEKAHEREIEANASLAEQERVEFAAMRRQEREQMRLRREAARREEMEERKEAEENRRDVLNRLAAGQDAESVTREGQKVTLKKRLDRQAAAERQRQLHAAAAAKNGDGGLVIKGLKAKQKSEPEAPIDPFGGLHFAEGRQYYTLQDDYVWAGVQETKADTVVGAGGYDVRSFTSRALCEAFAGLGVFLADEMAEREKEASDGEATGPNMAEVAAKHVKMEDPF